MDFEKLTQAMDKLDKDIVKKLKIMAERRRRCIRGDGGLSKGNGNYWEAL